MTMDFKEHIAQIKNLLVEDYNLYLELDSLKRSIISRRKLISFYSFGSWLWISFCIFVSKPIESQLSVLAPMALLVLMTIVWSFLLIQIPLWSVVRLANFKSTSTFRDLLQEFQRNQIFKLFLINNSLISSIVCIGLLLIANPVAFFIKEQHFIVSLFLSIISYFWICPLANEIKDKTTFLKYRFWRKRDEFNIPNLVYYYLFPERYNTWWCKKLELIGRYKQSQEIIKAESSSFMEEEVDSCSNTIISSLLVIPKQKEVSNLVINNFTFFINRKVLLGIGLKVMEKEIKLSGAVDYLKYELQQIPILFRNGRKLSFWDLALMSQDPDIVESLYTPGLEYLPSIEGASVISKISDFKLRQWFKKNTSLYRSSYLPLLGGWDEQKILVGAEALPKLQFTGKEVLNWESLNLSNRRLKKLFFNKLTVSFKQVPSVNMSLLNSVEKEKIWDESSLTAIHGNLVNFILEIKEFNFDLNIVANFIEKINFTDLALNTTGKIWSQNGYYASGINKEPLSIFGAYLTQLRRFYSAEKSLKILVNSLYFEDHIWKDSLNNWLRIERNPELFSIPPLPSKVKDIKTLQKHFEKTINLRQNPELILDQSKIQSLQGSQIGNWVIHVPKTNRELIEVGEKFKICLGNGVYFEKIKLAESFIFFLKALDVVEYVVEINAKGEIIQARTLQNNMMHSSNMNEISNFCRGCLGLTESLS